MADAANAPRIHRKEISMWDVETIQRFLEPASLSRYQDFYSLAVLTGMRRSEIAGLQWDNVDLESGRGLDTPTHRRARLSRGPAHTHCMAATVLLIC